MIRFQLGFAAIFALLLGAGCATVGSRGTTTTIIVKKDDTLNTIAKEYGTTWQALVEMNRSKLAGGLREGQQLTVSSTPSEGPSAVASRRQGGSKIEELSSIEAEDIPEDEEPNFLERPNKGLLFGPQSKEPVSLIYPVECRISSHFGKRGRRNHKGIDLAASVGTPIMAAGDGEVIFAGRQKGYGSTIVIDHGQFMTLYAHASKLIARIGARVRQGEFVAKVGRTGNARGAHLHFELRNFENKPLDPELYLHHKAVVLAGSGGKLVAWNSGKAQHSKIKSSKRARSLLVSDRN
jgi:lipoprotein NlpD